MTVNVFLVQEILSLVSAENLHGNWLFIHQAFPDYSVSEISIQFEPLIILSGFTHFPSPTIEIGFKLSTLYKFDEYPGPEGAKGDASG